MLNIYGLQIYDPTFILDIYINYYVNHNICELQQEHSY